MGSQFDVIRNNTSVESEDADEYSLLFHMREEDFPVKNLNLSSVVAVEAQLIDLKMVHF